MRKKIALKLLAAAGAIIFPIRFSLIKGCTVKCMNKKPIGAVFKQDKIMLKIKQCKDEI
jgi:hypothetical protein